MVYAPDWEPIGDALARVVAAGATKNEAKSDLCYAVADQKIAVRVHLAADAYRGLPATTLLSPVVTMPTLLSPEDFDWRQSRASKTLLQRWSIVQQRPNETIIMFGARAGHLVDRLINLVEVSTTDVIRVLCGIGARSEPLQTIDTPEPRLTSGAKEQGIRMAIVALWSKRIPQGLSAKDRDNQIIKWLQDNGCSIPQNPQRAIWQKSTSCYTIRLAYDNAMSPFVG